MYSALHLGFEHPNLVWLVGTAILAFAAGLGVATYRFFTTDESVSPVDTAEKLQ